MQSRRPEYRCKICGEESDPTKKSQKRSISMHVNKEHKVPKGEASDYWEKIGGQEEERTPPEEEPDYGVSEPARRTAPTPESGNFVYIVQAEFDSNFEAESEMQTLLQNKPDFEDFTTQVERFVMIRCSSRERAQAVSKMVDKYVSPVRIEIHREEGEMPRESRMKGIKERVSSLNPFGGNGGQKVQSPATQGENPTEVIGYTISADNYRHFQRSEASAADMHSLTMLRQALAKGEMPGGTDVMKWVGGISVLMIVGVIALYMFRDMVLGEGGISLPIPGLGGGGGGAQKIPYVLPIIGGKMADKIREVLF